MPNRKLARGTIYNMGAKLTYLFCGYGIFVIVGRMLGPRDLGLLGIVFVILNVAFLFLKNGVPQAAARYIGGDLRKASVVLAKAIKINMSLGSFLFALSFLGSDIIASDILNDENVAPFIRLGSLTILPVALYNTFSGSLIGARDFQKEAVGGSVTSILRIAFAVLFILLGYSIKGVILAYALAALSGSILLFVFCRYPKANYRLSMKGIIGFVIPLIINGALVTLLLNIDSIFVKRITGSDTSMGFYFAGASAAHAMYHVFSAFGVTLLPSISGAYTNNDMALTRKYIHQAIRYNMLLGVPIVAIVCGSSQQLMNLLYGDAFQASGEPFLYLTIAALFMILSNNMIMCITAVGHSWLGPLFYLITIVIACPLLSVLIGTYDIVGAGISMAVSCFLCFSMSIMYVQIHFAGVIDWSSMIRVVLSGIVIYMVAILVPFHGAMLFPWYLVLSGIYCVLMLVFKEWRGEDSDVLKGILRRRNGEVG